MLKKSTLKQIYLTMILLPVVAVFIAGGPMFVLGLFGDVVVASLVVSVLIFPLLAPPALAVYELSVPRGASYMVLALGGMWIAVCAVVIVGQTVGSAGQLVGVVYIITILFGLCFLGLWACSFVEFLRGLRSKNEDVLQKAKRFKVVCVRLGIFLVMYAVVLSSLLYLNRNYAEEVARPIEKSLVNFGAVKMCIAGSSGRAVIGDKKPTYSALFETPNTNDDTTLDIVERAFVENGFMLKSAGVNTYGDAHYSAKSKELSGYNSLEGGAVEVFVTIYKNARYAEGSVGCYVKDQGVDNASHNKLFLVNVELPKFKD